MTDSLGRSLTRASSRLTPPRTPLASVLVGVLVLVVWTGLLAQVWGRGGLLAWSLGLGYLMYDVGLQVFTGWQIAKIAAPIAAVPNAPDAAPARDSSQRVSVAVLIAAHNEAAALPATIAALLDQTDPPDEIVLADDGSTDGTAAWLDGEFGLTVEAPVVVNGIRLTVIPLPHGGKATALNAALLVTTADVVLTVDADTVLDSGALAAVRTAFAADLDLVGVTGVITPVCAPTVGGAVLQYFQTYEYIRNFLARYAWMRVDCLQLISGAFAGFRREAVATVGGFDAATMVEDYELVARMYRYAGDHDLRWRFAALGAAQAHTEAPGTVAAFLRQRRRWFGEFLQTHWWYRAMVGERRYGRLGTLMLPVKTVDTLAPVYGLTALGLLAYFLITWRTDVLVPVAVVVGVKLLVDVVFMLWSVRRYRRWVGDPQRASALGAAASVVAGLLTFQVLLQLGALLGWGAALRGNQRWGRQDRFGIRGGTGNGDSDSALE
ncbi:MAG TPA: glycosyltransferase [Gordonia sp. (in: high G+C Gram-positive bacteria)]|uniref:glycosyltransferase family 2 protein n=1 Tax=unclassified Gordonia (in: high G+C Gram-positive bacteria) TaxID=2657482 RepID=UPI0025C17981|nr:MULTISPECIES: glycosyltransferase [unclassified Gordonia (in: high G+C Gram-positive bacteria)]HNP58865.1 glycosyltransferase [Gordonia sp. (in: high G+C Gram-positive bacteria)]HRC52173.1 glycosyltransferase [Gordonia sp. (in: high G+C Gram-positive bacteria)]